MCCGVVWCGVVGGWVLCVFVCVCMCGGRECLPACLPACPPKNAHTGTHSQHSTAIAPAASPAAEEGVNPLVHHKHPLTHYLKRVEIVLLPSGGAGGAAAGEDGAPAQQQQQQSAAGAAGVAGRVVWEKARHDRDQRDSVQVCACAWAAFRSSVVLP